MIRQWLEAMLPAICLSVSITAGIICIYKKKYYLCRELMH